MAEKDTVSKHLLERIVVDLARWLFHLEILSTSRDLADTIREEEKMLTVSIEELPSYALGREAGLEQGELARARSVLIRLLEHKLGPLDDASRERIQGAPLDRLTEDSIESVLR